MVKNLRAKRCNPYRGVTQSLLQEGCAYSWLTFKPYQQAQAHLSVGAGGLWLPSKEGRKISKSIGSRVGASPEVLAGLTGPLGNKLRRGLPESSIIAQLGGSLREIRETSGVTIEAMVGSAPEAWLQ